MLFKMELIEKIVAGEKTQTRRPVKDGEQALVERHDLVIRGVTQNGRLKMAVGRDYAVQPGRGKPGCWIDCISGELLDPTKQAEFADDDALIEAGYLPLRIRVTEIHREDVREISHVDAVDEGFDERYGAKYSFLETWCSFYDPSMVSRLQNAEYVFDARDHCPVFLRGRPDELYQGWAYTFEVV